MASRATSLFIFFFLISCTFMLLETNASKNKSRSDLPLCGFREHCDGLWCPGKGGKYSCINWSCNFIEDCEKRIRCEKTGPCCFDGLCDCTNF
ncbi:unnamed protein product [Arabidopsis thaliana]|uniref:Uncharacterized protein n=1 Tax=Arabidopsis thaliana TaxID=3702 RepID=A0A654ERR4_ARATH|nr:unnamed protein product [Arabidopsis thaliana]